MSVRSIERWEKDPALNFPKAIRYGYRSPLYNIDELEAWDRTRREAQINAIGDLDIEDLIGEAAE